MTEAAVYVRISADREGESLGVKRQEADCRALAERRGWPVVEVYKDNDISAVHHRPEWERMLADISAGRVGAVLAYSSSRLYRDVDGDKARLFAACMEQDQNGDRVQIETVVSGTIHPYSADGRMLANILASVDAAERERVGERARRMLRGKKDAGEWIGRVPFGWKLVGKHLEQDEDQQAVLRDAARRYVEGESFNTIAADLGMATAVLSRILHSDRVHDALPDDLSEPLVEALVARKYQRVPTSLTSLLGGIARCGICGGSMSTSSTRAGRKSGSWGQYRCSVVGHAGIARPWLDDYVSEQVVEAIDVDKLLASRRKSRKPTRKASAIEARIEHLNNRYVEGKVRPADFDRMSASLLEQLKEAQQSERSQGVDLPLELARNLGERWGTFSIETRRRIIAAAVESIVVNKAEGHGPIDPDRIEITWRS